MKRCLMLVLTLCLVVSAAFGTACAENKVLQDEQTPVLVTKTNENDEVISAVICDAEGKEVAQIKDDGSVTLTDVHFRSLAVNADAAARLTAAYQSVMSGVHYSDAACAVAEHEVVCEPACEAECEVHVHSIKEDINAELLRRGSELTAHELVMYEMFDVHFAEETVALLPENGCVELTLETADPLGAPYMALFTADGAKWQLLPTANRGGNRFTVQLSSAGTLALLCDGQKHMGIGVEKEFYDITTESSSSSGYTPSVAGQAAPQIVKTEAAEGYVGYMCNLLDNTRIRISDRNYVLVTSVAERSEKVDVQTYEHLGWGYDSVTNAANVGELATLVPVIPDPAAETTEPAEIPELTEGTLAAELDAALQLMELELTHEQLVVKDLFEVSAYGEYLNYLYNEDYYLQLTLDAKLDPSKPLLMICSTDSEYWYVKPAEEFVLNQNGTVSVKLPKLGVIAFLVPAEETVAPEEAVQSPV